MIAIATMIILERRICGMAKNSQLLRLENSLIVSDSVGSLFILSMAFGIFVLCEVCPQKNIRGPWPSFYISAFGNFSRCSFVRSERCFHGQMGLLSSDEVVRLSQWRKEDMNSWWIHSLKAFEAVNPWNFTGVHCCVSSRLKGHTERFREAEEPSRLQNTEDFVFALFDFDASDWAQQRKYLTRSMMMVKGRYKSSS